MDPVQALTWFDGAARRNDLIALGVDGNELSLALRLGKILRPYFGTYALRATPPATIAAAALRGEVACLSACESWGLATARRPDVPHIIVPRDRHVKQERVDRLRLTGVHRDDAAQRRVQPVDLAVDHVARCTTPLEQLIIVDSALNKRHMDPMATPVFTVGTARRCKWLEAHASALSDSPPETVAFAALRAAGFRPKRQVVREHGAPVDITVGTRHVIEIDGYKDHSSPRAFRRDRMKTREIAAVRDWNLPYTYWDVMTNPLAFALDVARITGLTPDPRLEARIRWMTTMPAGHLNRNTTSDIEFGPWLEP